MLPHACVVHVRERAFRAAVRFSIYVYIYIYIYVGVYLSISISVSIYLPICIYVTLFVIIPQASMSQQTPPHACVAPVRAKACRAVAPNFWRSQSINIYICLSIYTYS